MPHLNLALRTMTKSHELMHTRAIQRRQDLEVVTPCQHNILSWAPGFRAAYSARPGSIRRKALLALFQRYPDAKLPINQRWMANLKDTDLAKLLKLGYVQIFRDGARKTTKLNRNSNCRTSYLMLAKA